MEELLTNVNWTAVAVGFVVSFVAGWLWYSDHLFGKGWRAGSRLVVGSGPMLPPMLTQAAGSFLLAWTVGVLAVSNALALTILIAITIGTLMAAGGLFMQRSRYAISVDVSYVFVMVVIMVSVHSFM